MHDAASQIFSRLFRSNRPYIKEHQKQHVREHRYQGQELSYSYNYFYSPLCTKIAENLPMWLAPNLISVIGFLCNLIPHLMVPLLFTTTIEGDLPNWFCYLMGVSFFMYMLCDNTDGKQARRTGSSSPMGMLIDHGMDSVTAVINNILMQTLVGSVLEQYYTGELILQVVNGIDDGSFVYIYFCFVCGLYGHKEYFSTPISILGFDSTYREVLYYTLVILAPLQSITNFINIYKARNKQQFKKLFNWESFIGQVIWFIVHCLLFFTAAYLSPENIMETHPRRVEYAFGLQFILIALRLQFSGVTQDRFNPFRRTSLLVWALLIGQIFFSINFKQSIMHEPTLYLIMDIVSFASIVHMVYFLLQEFCEILDINVLTLTQKQLDAQKETKKKQ